MPCCNVQRRTVESDEHVDNNSGFLGFQTAPITSAEWPRRTRRVGFELAGALGGDEGAAEAPRVFSALALSDLDDVALGSFATGCEGSSLNFDLEAAEAVVGPVDEAIGAEMGSVGEGGAPVGE